MGLRFYNIDVCQYQQLAVVFPPNILVFPYLSVFIFPFEMFCCPLLQLGATTLLGVRSPWAHFYEIEVSTGIWRNSGTTAKVFIVLEGENGSSRPYHLKGDSCIPFARGSIFSFILSIPVDIGPLQKVRVWHDNSGTSPSWFLNHIEVSVVITAYLYTAISTNVSGFKSFSFRDKTER